MKYTTQRDETPCRFTIYSRFKNCRLSEREMKMKSLCLIGVVHLVSLHEGVMRICEKGDSRRELLCTLQFLTDATP